MKPIKLTQSSIAKAKAAFLEGLDQIKMQGTKIKFEYDFAEILKQQLENKNIKTPVVHMCAKTYLKMLEYVLSVDTEIAWHGTVERVNYDKNDFFEITDVYLYPQKVTGSTVQTDDTKYTCWSDKQPEDTFNKRRFQGHSHVNMGVFYSGTDEDNKNKFLQDLLDDDFYIFVVMNKRQEINIEVYDLAQNTIFEKEDVQFIITADNTPILEQIKEEIKTYLEKPTYEKVTWPVGYYSDNKRSYYGYGVEEYTPASYKKDKVAVKIKRHVVILNRNGKDFEKEHPEFEGDIIENHRFNGKDYRIFIPFKAFDIADIVDLRVEGWHIREMPIPDEYDL